MTCLLHPSAAADQPTHDSAASAPGASSSSRSRGHLPRLANGTPDARRLLTWAHVREYLDMGPTAAWKLRKTDARFPKPVLLPGVHPRWDVQDLDLYLETIKAAGAA